MLCPRCHATCSEDEGQCPVCGADLMIPPSRSLVARGGEILSARRAQLPDLLLRSPVPRLAAGVGAVAVGVGIELLRRKMVSLLAHPARPTEALPVLGSLRNVVARGSEKSLKLPKGYEVQETVVYMQRVIRRRE